MLLDYPFTEAEMREANRTWHANCGPAALAFALQVPLAGVRYAIPDFERKRYTTPTMMRAALDALGVRVTAIPSGLAVWMANLFGPPAVVRVQFTGPWTAPGANPRWAYRHTHWVATWREGVGQFVFDVNGGLRSASSWQTDILPVLANAIPRADGGWHPTHIWRVEAA
jgi:hypothetical protein